ncbi:MAG TPA: alpha-L-fucosidase, partial [Roseiflexaceae bacterium]|nr:alpha-L-fucosidase [Roseiflexaceae bacterium]
MDTNLFDNWFPYRRFGLFIHWGLYAIPGWHEQHMGRLGTPRDEYARLSRRFNPQKFDPDTWLDEAEAAGMRYVCFTTKHHDGFCMWDTRQTSFNVMQTPYGRDVLQLLAAACERRGFGLSLYYSNPDWHHPHAYNPLSSHQVAPAAGDRPDQAAYVAFIREQIRELCSNYGKIISLFWDIPPRFAEPSLNELVRRLQPGIMINDRGHAPGDYATPERHVPEGLRFETPTEACQSVGRQSWGYRRNEDYYSNRVLTSSIDKIMAMGGNYLLNIGPKADGTLPARAVRSLRNVGAWYRRVRESLEGAEPASHLLGRNDFLLTRRANTLYVHFCHGLEASGIALNPLVSLPQRATLLNTGRPVRTEIERMPTRFAGWGEWQPIQPCLHLYDIPVDRLSHESIVVKLEFTDLDDALRQAGIDA